MVLLFILSLFLLPQLQADSKANLGIDRAIEYSQAGRYDLAEKELIGLLSQPLGPVEKATVLYNLAVAQAIENKLAEAVASLDQITPDMYGEVITASPLLAVSISYDGAAFSIRHAKSLLGNVANIDSIAKAINTAKGDFTQLDLLLKKNIIPLDISQPAFVRIHIEEEIATLEIELSELRKIEELNQESKSELLDSFADLLWGQFFDSSSLFRAKSAGPSSWQDYFVSFDKIEFAKIQLYLMRLVTFLNAPAKSSQAAMNGFFTRELLELQDDMAAAIADLSESDLLLSLYNLMSTVTVMQGQVLGNDITVLLDNRTAVVASFQIDKENDFWMKEWQAMNNFAGRYLAAKEANTTGLESALLAILDKQLNREPDVQKCLATAFYWQVLSTPETKTFEDLATTLHGAKSVDTAALKKSLEPLLARVKADKITLAIPPLENTLKQLVKPSPILLYQDVMIGWFFADPENSLAFLFHVTSKGMNAIQTKSASRYDAFIAHADYQLLLHLLDLLIPQQGASVLGAVIVNLNQQLSWFLDPKKNDLTFFRMSLELDWLKTILLVRTATLEKITESVDFEVLFQKKTLTLTRFAGDSQYLSCMEELALMQAQMASEVASALSKMSAKSKKIKEAEDLMDSVVKLAPSQTKDVPTMMQVLTDLAQASEILHSLQSQSESNAASNAEQQSTNLSHEIPKKALQLSADNAIQLLQEMEREDKSLEQPSSANVSAPGGRQW